MTGLAINQRVCETFDVAASPPYVRVHKDGGVETNHIVSTPDERAPPVLLDIALEFHTQRAVVPRAGETAVDFAALEYEAPALAERYNLV